MIDQVFESLRKAQESSMQMHQEMMNYWAQPWRMASSSENGQEWGRDLQRRWADLTLELLDKHRASLDSMYRGAIQVIEQSFKLAQARSAEDLRQTSEELWRKLMEVSRDQSETQLREVQRWAERSFQMTTAATQQNGKA
jgi:hypothetical protein